MKTLNGYTRNELSLNKNLEHEKKMKMIYTSCSDRMCIDNFGDLAQTGILKYSIKNNLYEDGWKHNNKEEEYYLNKIIKLLQENIIDSIEILYNNRVVHKFKKENIIMNYTSDYWDNCIDIEYLKFNEWYVSNYRIVENKS